MTTTSAMVIFKQISMSSNAVGNGIIIMMTIMTRVTAIITSLYFCIKFPSERDSPGIGSVAAGIYFFSILFCDELKIEFKKTCFIILIRLRLSIIPGSVQVNPVVLSR